MMVSLGTAVRGTDVRSFMETHCIDCHDTDARKGDFDMEPLLKVAHVTAESSKEWARIVARLEAGEMPPPKRERPPAADLEVALQWTKQGLAEETRARRATAGMAMRRLNRLEYENTMRDLLGIETRFRALLPEDGSAEGFDTVAEALRISPVHIQRYMAAADLAIDSAIMRGEKPVATTHRFLFTHAKEQPFIQRNQQSSHGPMIRVYGEELRFYNEPGFDFPIFVKQFSDHTKKQPGRYRIRVAARTINGMGHQTVLEVRTARDTQRAGVDSLGWFEVPDQDAPQVVELEAWFDRGESLVIAPYRLNDLRRQLGFSQYAQDGDDMKTPGGPGLGVAYIEVEGPLVDRWPSAGHELLFGGLKTKPFKKLPKEVLTPGALERLRTGGALTPVSDQPAADAERLLRGFLPKAFRRPVAGAEIKPYLALVQGHLARSECFESAMRAAYRAALCSPDFLFLMSGPGLLDDHALASRLSYFLWRTAPDDALRSVADRGELHDADVLRRETERLLKSPRSRAFVEDFLDQWLHLRDIDATQPDKLLFPEFYVMEGGRNARADLFLRHAMLEETRLFFTDLLTSNSSTLHLLDSDYTFANNRLATYYDLPAVKGLDMQRISLPKTSPRGGVLTQASVLKVTANGTRTSPVVRGVWVLENILDRKPPAPPANVGAIDPDTRGSTTIREQLAKHQSSASCASCHRQIDPPGFALESFDPAGRWRTAYRSFDGVEAVKKRWPQPPAALGQTLKGRDLLGKPSYLDGQPVDATGELLDGRRFNNIRELKKHLLGEPHVFVRCLASKMLTFATGRPTEPGDLLALDQLTAESAKQDHRLRELVHAVIASELFGQ